MDERLGAVLVVIPTYNERDNLARIVARLHASVPDAHVLVVDDSSPDGTGRLADELAAADERVHVLHRAGKEGLGAAYIAGFGWALAREYGVIVEMDADGSHAPEQLPDLLAALDGDASGTGDRDSDDRSSDDRSSDNRSSGDERPDVVLGSRYVPGGRVVNWPRHREWLSRGGNLYCRLALGVPLRDITGGYRAYRRRVLEKLALDEVASQGYCFQVDLAWRASQAGFRVLEVPITFTERALGQSKMSGSIVREALWRVTRWGARHRVTQLRGHRG